MLSVTDKKKLVDLLRFDPEFASYSVVYSNCTANGYQVLYQAAGSLSEGNVLAIKEEQIKPADAPFISPKLKTWGGAILKMAGSCMSAVTFASVSGAEAVVIPFTAGASAALEPLTIAAAAASAYQCGTSTVQLVYTFAAPENNAILEGNTAYRLADDLADVASLAHGAGEIVKGLKTWFALRKISDLGNRSIISLFRKNINHDLRAAFTLEYNGVNNFKELKTIEDSEVMKVLRTGELRKFSKDSLKALVSALDDFTDSATNGAINHGARFIIELVKSGSATNPYMGKNSSGRE